MGRNITEAEGPARRRDFDKQPRFSVEITEGL
jgi:hypothetical protein